MNGDDESGSRMTKLGRGQNPKETKETKPKFSIPNKNSTRTIGFGVQQERSVLGGSVLGCDDLTNGAIGAMRV